MPASRWERCTSIIHIGGRCCLRCWNGIWKRSRRRWNERALRVVIDLSEAWSKGVVEAYLDAKLRQRDTSVALYRIASDLDGDRLVEKVRQRSHKAVVSMLRSAPLSSPGEVEFATFMFLSAIAGATRSVLEAGAPPGKVRGLRKHLVMLGEAYLGRALMLPT